MASLLPEGLTFLGPPFNEAKVRGAIHAVAAGIAPKDERERATEYIADVRRCDAGWMSAINLLKLDMNHAPNEPELQWAAKTLEDKVTEDLARLNKKFWPNLRDLLLEVLLRCTTARGGAGLYSVQRPAAVALASLACQWTDWTGVVDSIRSAITTKCNAASGSGGPASELPPAGQPVLVSVLSEMPRARERAYRKKAIGRGRYAALQEELIAARPKVAALLDAVMAGSQGRPGAVCAAMDCMAEWLDYKAMGAREIAPPSRLVQRAFQLLRARATAPGGQPPPPGLARLSAMDGVLQSAFKAAHAAIQRVSDEAIVHLRQTVPRAQGMRTKGSSGAGAGAGAGAVPDQGDTRGPEGLLRLVCREASECAGVGAACEEAGDDVGAARMVEVVSWAANCSARVLLRPHGALYGGLLQALVRCTGSRDHEVAELTLSAWSEVSRVVLGPRSIAGGGEGGDDSEEEHAGEQDEEGELREGKEEGEGEGGSSSGDEDRPIVVRRTTEAVHGLVQRAYTELAAAVLGAIEVPEGYEDMPKDRQDAFLLEWRYAVCGLLGDACRLCGTRQVGTMLLQQLQGQMRAYRETKGSGRRGKPSAAGPARLVGTWRGVEAALYALRGIHREVPLSMAPLVRSVLQGLDQYPREPECVATMCRLVTVYREHMVRVPSVLPKCAGLLRMAVQRPHPSFSVQAGNALGYFLRDASHALPPDLQGQMVAVALSASPAIRDNCFHRLAPAALASTEESQAEGRLKAVLKPAVDRLAADAKTQGPLSDPQPVLFALQDLEACFFSPLALEVPAVRADAARARDEAAAVTSALARAEAQRSGGAAPLVELEGLQLPARRGRPYPMGGWTGRDSYWPAPDAGSMRVVKRVLDYLWPLLMQALRRRVGQVDVVGVWLDATRTIVQAQRPCSLGLVQHLRPALPFIFGHGYDQVVLEVVQSLLSTCCHKARPEHVPPPTRGACEMMALEAVGAVVDRVLGTGPVDGAAVQQRAREQADFVYRGLQLLGTAAALCGPVVSSWPGLPRALELAVRVLPSVNLDVAVQACRAVSMLGDACLAAERQQAGAGAGAGTGTGTGAGPGQGASMGRASSEIRRAGAALVRAGLEAALLTMTPRVINSSTGSVSAMVRKLRLLGGGAAREWVQAALGQLLPPGAVPPAAQGEVMEMLASDRLPRVDEGLFRLRRARERADGARHREVAVAGSKFSDGPGAAGAGPMASPWGGGS